MGPSFTVMLWKPKGELRVVDRRSDRRLVGWRSPTHAAEFEFLPEHKNNPPWFATVEEGFKFIAANYPHLSP